LSNPVKPLFYLDHDQTIHHPNPTKSKEQGLWPQITQMDADEELFFSLSASICVHLRAIPDSVAAGHAGRFGPFRGKPGQVPGHEPFTRQNEFSDSSAIKPNRA
jgi:hypothetical protein